MEMTAQANPAYNEPPPPYELDQVVVDIKTQQYDCKQFGPNLSLH